MFPGVNFKKSSMVGAVFISFAAMGYVNRPAELMKNNLFFISALLLIYPGLLTDTIGFLIGFTVLFTLVGKRIVKTLLVKLSA